MLETQFIYVHNFLYVHLHSTPDSLYMLQVGAIICHLLHQTFIVARENCAGFTYQC